MVEPNKAKKHTHSSVKRIVFLAALLLFLYAVVPQISSFKDSLNEISNAHAGWLFVALIATLATYLAATGQYYLLALKPVKFGRTLAVESASAFASKILPAGVGGVSLNIAYLRRAKHNFTEASVVVAMNNLLGLFGNVLIVSVIALAGAEVSLDISPPNWVYLVLALVIALVVVGLLIVKSLRRKAFELFRNIVRSSSHYRSHYLKLIGALLCATLLTLVYAVVLYCSVRAIGWTLPFAQVFIVYIGSVAIGTATPTPGGVVGVEAALAAGLVAYGLPAGAGLAIALTYRLITYWLPLIIGYGIFEVIRRKQII